MAHSWRTHGANSWRSHGAFMAQTGVKNQCGGPVCALRHEPFRGFMAKEGARHGPGRSNFMAHFMAQSWRKLMAQVMAQETP